MKMIAVLIHLSAASARSKWESAISLLSPNSRDFFHVSHRQRNSVYQAARNMGTTVSIYQEPSNPEILRVERLA